MSEIYVPYDGVPIYKHIKAVEKDKDKLCPYKYKDITNKHNKLIVLVR